VKTFETTLTLKVINEECDIPCEVDYDWIPYMKATATDPECGGYAEITYVHLIDTPMIFDVTKLFTPDQIDELAAEIAKYEEDQ
jgi:hypothetical protein